MTGKQYAADVRVSAHGNSMHLTRHDKNKWESRKIEEEVLLLSKQKKWEMIT